MGARMSGPDMNETWMSPEIARGRPMRLPHWEHRLAEAIDAARKEPFAWGRHDCATWAFDLRRELAGGPDLAALWRGRYRTALGSRRVMRRLGWADMDAMGRSLLGAPRETVLLAQRGDIVLGPGALGFGICLGARAAGMAPEGLVLTPLASCALAWPS